MLYYVICKSPYGENELVSVHTSKKEAEAECKKQINENLNYDFHDLEDAFMAYSTNFEVLSEKEGLRVYKSERRWVGFLQTNSRVFFERKELLG